jgi:hypothetical protein
MQRRYITTDVFTDRACFAKFIIGRAFARPVGSQ